MSEDIICHRAFPGWLLHQGVDCDGNTGQGAINILPEPYSSSMSLYDCKAACEADGDCEAIVILAGSEAAGPCHERRNVDLGNCASGTSYHLFTKTDSGGK